MTYEGSEYVTCPKCGVNHSKLVKHRCFKPKEQDEPPEFDDFKEDGEGDGSGGEGGRGSDPKGQGEGQGNKGKGGDGSGEGEGEGEGEGDGEDEAEGGRKAPEPQPPEPEVPPVVVVCTVLKFAALTAACAKNGNIEITLTEDGLFVYGYNGDNVAHDVIAWGDLEQRATLDGEFFVKEIIDAVDAKLADPKDDMEKLEREVEKAKRHITHPDGTISDFAEPPKKGAGRKAKSKKADALTFKVGAHYQTRDGRVAKVMHLRTDMGLIDVQFVGESHTVVKHCYFSGRTYSGEQDGEGDLVAEAVLSLPLTVGQTVVCKDGRRRTVERLFDGGGSQKVAEYGDGIVTDAATADCDVHGGGGEKYTAVCDAA